MFVCHAGYVLKRFGSFGLLALLLLASCSVSAGGVSCVEPPASELAQVSPTVLTVEPNPVAAGSEAMLSIAADGLPDDALAGAAALWQCWNGSEWIDTHQIGRGWDGAPWTQELTTDETFAVPAIGLQIPNSYPILIPEVKPGLYRIEDVAGSPGGVDVTGFVFVEVVAAESTTDGSG